MLTRNEAIDYMSAMIGGTHKDATPNHYLDVKTAMDKIYDGIEKVVGLKYQTVYKGVVYCDNIDSVEDALSDIEHSCKHGDLDVNGFSIEVEIQRDKKRHNGEGDTRLTLKQMSHEYQTKEYAKAMKKIDELEELINRMNLVIKS